MLHENPAVAESGFPAAVVLGDATRVRAELRRDPGAATRVDPGSGWTALHLACASRFHLDPARAPGLAEVARLLLDAGAEIDGESRGRRCWRPLECAVTSANSSANNEPIIRLLLDRGAPVRPETLVAALYAAGGTWCLELLTEAAAGAPELFTEALVEAVIEADLDPVRVLLAAGADPDAPGRDGRSARRRCADRRSRDNRRASRRRGRRSRRQAARGDRHGRRRRCPQIGHRRSRARGHGSSPPNGRRWSPRPSMATWPQST